MRAIDGDALIKALVRKEPFSDCARVVIAECMEEVRHAPTIEPERKEGWWIIKETAYEDTEAKCSCCGFETLVDQPGNGLHMVNDLHYCPNCGADMREGEQDE